MAGNGIGGNDKRRTRRDRSNEKEPDVSYFSTSTLATAGSRNIAATDSWTKNPHDQTVCPLCRNKMEKPMSCMNTLVLCPHCNDFLLVSENSQGKFLLPLSSEISGCPSPEQVPVCTPRQQYDLALQDPLYFHIMRELVSSIKNKPFPAPVKFRGKELNVHRMFVEVTCRGGILKERRLQEVSAALAENLSDRDLYKIYMFVLSDLETWLCHFPPAPPLRPCSSHKNVSLMPRLREEQHPSHWVQASAPYTNAAPLNNSQQWTSLPAGFNNGSTYHSNRSSSGPCSMTGIILKGGQPTSSNLNPAVAYNNQMWITESSGSDYYSNFDSEGHRSCSLHMPYPAGPTQGFIGKPSEWIQASAPYTNSVAVKNDHQSASLQQTDVNFGSTYHPNGPSSNLIPAVANNNPMWITESSGSNNDSNFGSADHRSRSLPTPYPTGSTQGFVGQPTEWIQASAPYTNSVPMNNQQLASLQQTGVNFGSTYHPNGPSSHLNSGVANGNQVWVTAPHPIQASEQGSHDPSHNLRTMVKRKALTESLEPVKKTRMHSSHPNR